MSASYILLKENHEKQMSLSEANTVSTSPMLEHNTQSLNVSSKEHLDLFYTLVILALFVCLYVCCKRLFCSFHAKETSLSCAYEAGKEHP